MKRIPITNQQAWLNCCRWASEEHALRARRRDEHAGGDDVNATAFEFVNETSEIRLQPYHILPAEGAQSMTQDLRRLAGNSAIYFDHREWFFDGVPYSQRLATLIAGQRVLMVHVEHKYCQRHTD
ncbi:hypothetical protein D3C72_1294540 [compost metagenome]